MMINCCLQINVIYLSVMSSASDSELESGVLRPGRSSLGPRSSPWVWEPDSVAWASDPSGSFRGLYYDNNLWLAHMHVSYDCRQPLSESKIMKSKDLRPLWCWFCHDASTIYEDCRPCTWSCRWTCLLWVTCVINSAQAQFWQLHKCNFATAHELHTFSVWMCVWPAPGGGGGGGGAHAPCAHPLDPPLEWVVEQFWST